MTIYSLGTIHIDISIANSGLDITMEVYDFCVFEY